MNDEPVKPARSPPSFGRSPAAAGKRARRRPDRSHPPGCSETGRGLDRTDRGVEIAPPGEADCERPVALTPTGERVLASGDGYASRPEPRCLLTPGFGVGSALGWRLAA